MRVCAYVYTYVLVCVLVYVCVYDFLRVCVQAIVSAFVRVFTCGCLHMFVNNVHTSTNIKLEAFDVFFSLSSRSCTKDFLQHFKHFFTVLCCPPVYFYIKHVLATGWRVFRKLFLKEF